MNAEREARGLRCRQQHLVMGRRHAASNFHAAVLRRAWGGEPVLRAGWRSPRASRSRDLPASSAELLARSGRGIHLVVLDAPADALRDGDVGGMAERVSAIDKGLGRILCWTRCAQKRSNGCTLVACNRDNLLETTVTRANLARFWRRPRLLASYAGRDEHSMPLNLARRIAPAAHRRGAQRCGLSSIARAAFIAARGITSAQQLAADASAPAPARATAQRRAHGRRCSPMRSRRRQALLIVADYDADGATACAVGMRALRAFGATSITWCRTASSTATA